MGARIDKTIAPGVYRLKGGRYRVTVSVGDRTRGGRPREKHFPAGTSIKVMKAWQVEQRAALRRQGLVPARGTLSGDVPNYLLTIGPTLAFPKSREDEISAWLPRFGSRRRHTILREQVRDQVDEWLQGGVAASTIRHRMTALSMLYEVLDGAGAYNPVKALKRPTEPTPRPDGGRCKMFKGFSMH